MLDETEKGPASPENESRTDTRESETREPDEEAVDVKEAAAEASDDKEKSDEPSPEELKLRHEKEKSQIREKMLRIAADFDNYKKRIQREFREKEERARADVLKTILPTVDNLHRAVDHSKKSNDLESVINGIEMAERNFLETLARFGITRLESKGEVFDPAYHEAIAQQESKDVPMGSIIEEIQAGYTMNDKLLRAALVVVSSGKPKAKEAQKEEKAQEAGQQPKSEKDNEGADNSPQDTDNKEEPVN